MHQAIAEWEEEKNNILKDGKITHERSREYASHIMEAVVTNQPYKIGGNVINKGMIENLPAVACVEVPCMIDGNGVNPCRSRKTSGTAGCNEYDKYQCTAAYH